MKNEFLRRVELEITVMAFEDEQNRNNPFKKHMWVGCNTLPLHVYFFLLLLSYLFSTYFLKGFEKR